MTRIAAFFSLCLATPALAHNTPHLHSHAETWLPVLFLVVVAALLIGKART
ncbi:hypothetical protein GG681_08745 [Epibacterium sp. SM1969]|uniref:Uncharacterized protein n=1 Tax=Tritonibacter aquimaris TaxID=2663379 RepID=A0A844ALT7_9RHOB|nr:hypothetical protein [Tritonibacter aquimaris]MQY42729.1 hypothetical protein [Tritonibacter aquimaris]